MSRVEKITRQKGTVLITVLLVVAFVVILVVEVNKTVNYQSQLNRNLIHRDQAYSYLIGMEELAKIYLKKSFDLEKAETVHLGQSWAQDDITFPFDGGVMNARITDMQSCFNLNSLPLIDKDPNQGNKDGNPAATQNKVTVGEEIFTVLLEKLLENTDVQASALSAEARDWIDSDQTPSGPDGAEDLYYQGLDIPYLPANGSMAHTSELRSVKSFGNKIYASIKDYICVLPKGEDNSLNVNTISEERAALLFAALGGKIAENKIKEAIAQRPEAGYKMQEFWDAVGAGKTVKKGFKQRIDVTSNYFQMDAKAEINRTKVYMKTLFVKEDDNQFKVVSRYFGKD